MELLTLFLSVLLAKICFEINRKMLQRKDDLE